MLFRSLLETGLVDLFMFSINPAYDYQKGEYAKGEVAERLELYRDCEKASVGISVMKPFAGGQRCADSAARRAQRGGFAGGAEVC